MEEVRRVARALSAKGKGILASDESPNTIGRRLEKHGIENCEESRRKYRSLFYSASIGSAISGAILFPETLLQSTDNGIPFVQSLNDQGVLVGVKVDEGLEKLEGGLEGETRTKGLDSLADRLVMYKSQGAVFAKWRAAIRICKIKEDEDRDTYTCSEKALETNAIELAKYAKICHEIGVCPIVEPEILIDGDHGIVVAESISKRVLSTCITYLWRYNVDLSAILLKPQMVVPGIDSEEQASSGDIALRTLRVLRQTVPPAVPGIMFLSGGQTEAQATENLNMLNVMSKSSENLFAPWALSFSFGRGLQASVLHIWSTKGPGSEEECKIMASKIAEVNGAATRGTYFFEKHPSVMAHEGNLQETFRGHY